MKLNWIQRAIIFTAAATPLYLVRFHIGPIPMTVFEILILFLAGAMCVRAIMDFTARDSYIKKFRRIPRALVIATILFFIASCISVFVAPSVGAALGIWRAYFVEAILFGLITWLHFESTEQLRALVWGFSVTAAIVGIYAIIQKITGWGILNPFWRAAETRRVTAFFGYPNAVALYVELVIPFFVGMLFIAREWWARVWFVFVLFVSALAIIFAQSSGAAAALVGTIWIFFVARKQTRVWAVAAAVLFSIALVLSPYKQKFADEFLLQGFSGQIRTHMWHETIEMLKPRWFVGAGLAGYETRVAPYHELKHVEIYLYPHNLVLTLWSELGVLGLISFAWIFGLVFVWMIRVMKQKKNEPRIWAGTIIAILCIIFIHGLVDIPYFKNDFSALFWILVAMALQVRYTAISHENF